MFSCVADIHVEVHGCDHMPLPITDGSPASRLVERLHEYHSIRTSPQVAQSRNLDPIVDVKEHMHGRIESLDVDNRLSRPNLVEDAAEYQPFSLSVEIVNNEKTSPEQVLPQAGDFIACQISIPDLSGL